MPSGAARVEDRRCPPARRPLGRRSSASIGRSRRRRRRRRNRRSSGGGRRNQIGSCWLTPASATKTCRRCDRGLDRRRSGLAEAADRRVAHRLAELGEQLQIAPASSRSRPAPPCLQPLEQLVLPHRADAARHALAARLVSQELGDAQQRVAQIDACRRTPSPRPSPASRRPRARPRRSAASSSASGPTNVPAAPPSSIACSGASVRPRRRPASISSPA